MMERSHFNRFKNPHAAGKDASILIVDDDPAVAKSIAMILSVNGLASNIVSGGHAALEELGQNDYELVLLDLNMPDMSGIEVIDRINRDNIDTNVIVVSGESEMSKAIHVLKNGAKDFIRKPYSTDELLFSVQNVLEKIYLERDNRDMVAKLEESEALHRFIVHNSPDLLYMLDKDGCFVFVNNNTVRSLGYSRRELIGKHYRDIIHPDDLERASMFFKEGQLPKETQSQELRLQCKNSGSFLHVEVRAINIEKKISGGYKLGRNNHRKENFVGTYGVARDITEKKKAEEIIRFQHNHDLLTGLPNRTLLNEKLKTLIAHSHENHEKFALLFIDINRFKLINETYGQSVGDKILRNLADNLRHCTRKEDTLARLGSDEFVLLQPDIRSKDDAIATAKKIITETDFPFQHKGQEIHTSLSVGIAIYPDHGENREQLIKHSDAAVCYTKAKAHKSYCLYSKKLSQKNSNTVFVENLIRDSIRDDRFTVHYQPQIDLSCGKIHAVEALVRIRDNDGSLILPQKFIDIAEETSLIIEIGNIVLHKVCRDIRAWNRNKLRLQVCVNVSAVQLAMDNFADYALEVLHSYAVSPHEIELELTENVLIQNIERSIANIVKLTDAGVKIAVDDFGTGYSSLSYLDHLPLHTLKLDKSFMKKISADNMDDTIIPAMISVSNGLKLDFIAEGVETKAQHDYLIQQGSCIAQGFYYSRPVEKERLFEFIKNYEIKMPV